MEKVLILFSGGKDSLLSSMLLIEKGFEVILVHYDNALEVGSRNVKIGYNRLLKKYGKDKVKYLGIKKTDAIFRTFIKDFYNLKVNEILNKYGKITFSEFNCLACSLSMYVMTIILCKQLNISYVADGARNNQLFSIEQDMMLNLFKELFLEYNIELLLPLKDLKDDFEEKNELLIRGIIPKVNESQCLIGMPLNNSEADNDVLKSSEKIYKELLYPKISELIIKYQNASLGDRYLW